MQTFPRRKRVGYWLSEKKLSRLNFTAFVDMCRKRGIEMIQLDLCQPLEDQGPLDVIIHKLTDQIVDADHNDSESQLMVQSFQDYIDAHPETVILDPMPAVRTLLDRGKAYHLISKLEECMEDDRICSPPFMLLRSECSTETLRQLQKHGITFPFICKTQVAHGTNSHQMAIIFCDEDLKDIKPPCVIQSFINHNAVLYKVFVVGEAYTVVERPSVRNFPLGPTDRRTILFNSHHVSKPESSSHLTSRDYLDGQSRAPCSDVIQKILSYLRQSLGMSLFGIDIIINNQTGQHAVIDINAFPGTSGGFMPVCRMCTSVIGPFGSATFLQMKMKMMQMTIDTITRQITFIYIVTWCTPCNKVSLTKVPHGGWRLAMWAHTSQVCEFETWRLLGSHAFPVSARISSRFSSFLPQSKGMHTRWIGDYKN
ncbi:inositol-tetrakisphosphate 1-kinase isoform X2 [Denticeps clupeoides]|nr:inositol-tetrakisphosphate 1-kinase-like isoform X2 [Denticeps clupeoides]